MDQAEQSSFQESTNRWDELGIFLSGLCALHCMVTPFLVLALPVMGSFFENEWVHLGMALFVAPVGTYAFWSGYRHHQNLRVFGLGLLGLLFVGGASLAPHSWVEFFGHDIITICGSVALIIAHILNRRACRCHVH